MTVRDYSITGPEAELAESKGLVGAQWYQTPVARQTMQDLVARSNGRAAIDTVLWLTLLVSSGAAALLWWGTWYGIAALAVYGIMYGSACDSRWHECGHGTAFESQTANSIVYYLASFMAFREPVSWRWSHARHHDDTIIVGRDLEIAVQRPTSIPAVVAEFFALRSVKGELLKLGPTVLGRIRPIEREYVPEVDRGRVVFWARLFSAIWVLAIVWSLLAWDLRPVLFIGGPTIYGRWLMVVYGLTQHAGLAEDVLDHRLNTRTVMMNPVHRFMYLNMNYHIEHHMFPTVPYHALPKLHGVIKDDLPPVYPSIIATYREIVPALITQAKDPSYFVRRPDTSASPVQEGEVAEGSAAVAVAINGQPEGWFDVCRLDQLAANDIVAVDHGQSTFAVYYTEDGRLFATDGACTHGRIHLAKGFLHGTVVECAKHNGRFDVTNGAALGTPATVDLGCHPVRVVDGMIQIQPPAALAPAPPPDSKTSSR